MKNIIIETINEYFQEQKNINDNFWKWFNGSKIVQNGSPLICYHGSSQKFDIFDFSKIGSNKGNFGHYGYGIYFSTDIRESKGYGNIIYECYLNIKKPFTGTTEQLLQLRDNGVGDFDDVVPKSIDFKSLKDCFKKDKLIFNFLDNIEKIGLSNAWLKIIDEKNETLLNKLNDLGNIAIEYSTLNKNTNGIPDYVFDLFKQWNINPKINKDFEYEQSLHWITNLGNNSKEVTEAIKKMGYDGVWYGSEIIPFYNYQIKSIHNSGAWNINNPNIYK